MKLTYETPRIEVIKCTGNIDIVTASSLNGYEEGDFKDYEW